MSDDAIAHAYAGISDETRMMLRPSALKLVDKLINLFLGADVRGSLVENEGTFGRVIQPRSGSPLC